MTKSTYESQPASSALSDIQSGNSPADDGSEYPWIQNSFLAFLFLSQIYYWYRYALQLGSTTTSPTYDPTPLAFQVAKYFLALFYCGGLALLVIPSVRFIRLKPATLWFNAFAWSFFFVIAFKYLISVGSEDRASAIALVKGSYVAPLVAISLPFLLSQSFLRKFGIWGVFIPMVYHVIYSAVQLALFFSIGRLPSLGYKNSLVRFGGGWDDPNGFGMFLILPFLYIITREPKRFWNKIIAAIYALLIVGLLAITVSYSALASFVCGVTVCLLLRNFKAFLCFVAAGGLLGIIVLNSEYLSNLVSYSYEQKLASLESHLSQADTFLNFFDQDWGTLLFGMGVRTLFVEDFYQSLLLNFGLIFFLIVVTAFAATILRGLQRYFQARRLGDLETARFLLIASCFVCAFSIGSIMISFFEVYPVNIYFWVFSGLIWAYPISDCRESASNSGDL